MAKELQKPNSAYLEVSHWSAHHSVVHIDCRCTLLNIRPLVILYLSSVPCLSLDTLSRECQNGGCVLSLKGKVLKHYDAPFLRAKGTIKLKLDSLSRIPEQRAA